MHLGFQEILIEILNAPCFSCGTIQSRQISCINSVITYIRSYVQYHFIANSTSSLNTAGFLMAFSVPVISQIGSIGGGQVGGGGGRRGRWESGGGLKQPFGHKQQCCAFSI